MADFHPQRKQQVWRRNVRRRIAPSDNAGNGPPPVLVRRYPHNRPFQPRHSASSFSFGIAGLLSVLAPPLGAIFVSFLIALFILLLPDALYFSTPRSSFMTSEPKLVYPKAPSLLTRRSLTISHLTTRGDTLPSIIKKYGLNEDSGQQLEDAVEKLDANGDAKSGLRPGQLLRLVFDGSANLKHIRSSVAPERELNLERTAEGKLRTTVSKIHREPRERVALGIIETSFAAAAEKAGIPYDIVDNLVDIMGNKISFHRDFRKGDRFTLIYNSIKDKKTHKPEPIILAANIQAGGKDFTAVRYVGTDGKARYYDQDGKTAESGFLRYPTTFSRISSVFSTSRFHPVLKYFRPHNGVDFAAKAGTPVRTVGDGEVVIAGRRGPSGLMIMVKHSQRYKTTYLHLQGIAAGVREGARVQRGQLIGYVGSTGLSSGPHLHYGFFDNGRYVDPLKLDLAKLTDLGGALKIHPEYLKRVLFTLRHYQNMPLSSAYFKSS